MFAFLSHFRLLEECFVTKDPFSPDKEKFLVLGSTCSLCSICVCVGSVRCLTFELLQSVSATDKYIETHMLDGISLHIVNCEGITCSLLRVLEHHMYE